MLVKEPIHIIGMQPGSLGLTSRTTKIMSRADVLVGGKRLLSASALACSEDNPICAGKQIPISGPLDVVLKKIGKEAAAGRMVVVLADGDPLFFGFGKRLLEEFGPDKVVVHPNLTTVQMAAARLKVPWQDMKVISLHGRTNMTPLFAALCGGERVAVYTDAENTPQAIAQALLEKGAEGFFLYVLEDLDTPQERVRKLSPEEVWDRTFSPLNIVVIEQSYPPEITLCLGIPDHYYFHEKKLITKQSVRAAGLAALNVTPGDTVWDLGSGCGSVAIEASYLARTGRVYAVERNKRRASVIRENQRRIGAWLVEVVTGETPACLDKLPEPDRVFIGGGLGESKQGRKILELASSRLKNQGRLVIHCILLDTLHRATAFIKDKGWHYGITQLQASTSDQLAGDMRFKAQNPVFILWAEKP